MLDKLSSGLKAALDKLTRAGYIDKKTIDELARDIQRTLLASDVDVKLVFKLTEKIKKRASDEKPPEGATAREHIIKIVYEELVNFIGQKPEISLKPQKILICGLFGSGKTTSIAKLANFYKKKGLKPALIGCDIHRPAAMDQLEQLGKQVNVPVHTEKNQKDAIKIAKDGLAKFSSKYDVLLFDSSGRDALDDELAKELKSLGETIQADETLLVIPADIGQAAGPQAAAFNSLVGITGIFLTKMDGTARGGGAITACSISGAPVKFIGTGEKLDALELFDPERFVSRLLGLGDLQTLLEKAKESMEPEKAKELAEKVSEGRLSLTDFYEQIKSVQKMGSLKEMMKNIPGFNLSKVPKSIDLEKQEEKMKKWKFIIDSMTSQEREEPDVINPSRISRIARGSGTSEADVRELLKNYKASKKVVKMVSGGGMKRGLLGKLAKKFGGKF